jgi:hypothetical protein
MKVYVIYGSSDYSTAIALTQNKQAAEEYLENIVKKQEKARNEGRVWNCNFWLEEITIDNKITELEND